MNWLKKLLPARIQSSSFAQKSEIPEGLWSKCPKCSNFLFQTELERNLFVCHKCDHHLRLTARKRIEYFLDEKPKYIEIAASIMPVDRLKFKDVKKYQTRIADAQKTTQENEALICVEGHLQHQPVVLAVFEFNFIGGSMSVGVGTKFVRAVERAIATCAPLICFASSGGVRMQESMFGLMQMAKVSAALNLLSSHRLPYISIMVDPCTGGVSASLAMLGDINIAEPAALIGFAGQRVIEQTVNQKLPPGFQSSEFLLEKGFLDMIVDRRELRQSVAAILNKLMIKKA